MMRWFPLAALSLALALPDSPAQDVVPTGKNAVPNGNFDRTREQQNVWYGVNSDGVLAGERGRLPVLTAEGTIGDADLPVSVAIADMNSDGLQDIVSMDVIGYLRIYFNKGTPQAPKFTTGELGDIFLSRFALADFPGISDQILYARRAPRVYVTSLNGPGRKDLLVGNYMGEIFLIPNAGTPQKPDFRQPVQLARAEIPTAKDRNQRWGNVFAPCTWDWDRDGKEDLIIGEGSYSANNIHLLLNQGSPTHAVFDDTNRFVIAYGDGREQLSPAVADYNGDGIPDILVCDRSGQVAVHLGKAWKKEAPELPFKELIPNLSANNPATLAAGDMNGDGLFDLVFGKADGRIAMSLNTGSKTEPKFGNPEDIHGDPASRPLILPEDWQVNYGLPRGNFYAFFTVVKAQEDPQAGIPDGSCLKAGYLSSQNTVMPAPSSYWPGQGKVDMTRPRFFDRSELFMRDAPARYFVLRQFNRFKLKLNTPYTVSFRVRGGRVIDGRVLVGWVGFHRLSPDEIKQSERGAVKVKSNEVREEGSENQEFTSSAQWSEIKRDFKTTVKAPELKTEKGTSDTLLEISFTLPPGSDPVYIDDVKIVEKTGT